MTNEVKILNSVTKTLIDSCKGYEMCAEVANDTPALRQEFMRRKAERDALVSEFQSTVRQHGGEPEMDGSMSGAVHRGFTRFSSMFQSDANAAVEALDDGEEFLAEKIEDKLEDNVFSSPVSQLLQKAHTSAKSGERFAELVENQIDAA